MTEPEQLQLSGHFSEVASQVLAAAEQATLAVEARSAQVLLLRQVSDFVASEGEVEGLTIDPDAVKLSQEALEQALFDERVIKAMAAPLAAEIETQRESDEPAGDTVSYASSTQEQRSSQDEQTRAKQPEGKVAKPNETQKTANSYLIAVLDSDGEILAAEDKSAATILRDSHGITRRNIHYGAVKLLIDRSVIRPIMKNARFINALVLNEKAAAVLIESGEFGPEARKSFERFLERKTNEGEDTSRLKANGVIGGHPKKKKTPLPDQSPVQQFHTGTSFSVLGLGSRPAPERAPRELGEKGKGINFRFTHAPGKIFLARLTGVHFGDVDNATRALIAIGQATDDRYSFLDTDARKDEFILKIVNKGRPDAKRVDAGELGILIEEQIEEGYLMRNGNGLELTDEGFARLDTDERLAKRDPIF